MSIVRRHINSYKPEERRAIMARRLGEIVQSHNGYFNELEYVNKRTPLLFRCLEGHEWMTQPQAVLNGSWCRECWEKKSAGNHFKLIDGLTQAQNIAAERGGICLSNKFDTSKTKMLWKCHNGHEWQSVFSDVKKGTWCPECGAGARERLVRHYFEEITGSKFLKKKPEWLLNVRGNKMELDGFSVELNMAFEHQGEQHYHEVPHFNRQAETLVIRKEDDAQKRILCEKNNVKLIEVPYYVETEDLPIWIYSAINSLCPTLNLRTVDEIKKTAYIPSTELKILQDLAIEQGGKCLSNSYLGSDKKHFFMCSKGHEWEASAINIKSGTWCPKCKPEKIGQSIRKHSVESMNGLASKKSGKFLSTIFESVNNKYEWECALGHVWMAAPSDINKGTWCPVCANNGLLGSLESMRVLANSKGGECISLAYVNSQTKLRWKCRNGHEWEARPDNVKNRNSWCPICSKKRTDT